MDDQTKNNCYRRAEELIHRILDYSLTDAEHSELRECLRQDTRARELFLQQSLLHSALRDRAQPPLEQSLCSRLFGVREDEIPGLSPLTAEFFNSQANGVSATPINHPNMACQPLNLPGSQHSVGVPASPLMQSADTALGDPDAVSPLRFWQWPGTLGTFGTIFCLLIAVGVWTWLSENTATKPVSESKQFSQAPPAVSDAYAEYVARIVKATEGCQWADHAGPAEFLLRVRAGDRMKLLAGLVELEFQSGAHVILHGPAVFIPTGPASGQLEAGRLTGEASNGNFRLITPAAEVVDLGTAFGVVADAEAGTDVVVFDGKVQVMARSEGNASPETINMTEGMAARFRFDGTTEFGLKTDGKEFARQISPSGRQNNPDEICLIDVIAGGNGLGASLAGAIDPLTGQRDYGEQGRKSKHYGRWTDGTFHRAEWHPLIDGVFVPFPTGHAIQIDSRGRALELPNTTGTTHGSIWARRRESISDADGERDNDFWGTRTLRGIVSKLKNTQIGLVGMHSNVGITLDLRALRMAHRRTPVEFRAAVANIENSADWAPHERPIPEVTTKIADCRIFVDGDLRTSHLKFGREDGDLPLAAMLAPGDRFLTILVTDGDGEMRFDHVVLIDPVIALAKE